jgi:hypothetical protein
MPKKLTLTSTLAAGIEESTYLACVCASALALHASHGDRAGAGPARGPATVDENSEGTDHRHQDQMRTW